VLTLSEATTLLSAYVGAGLDFNTRLNLARERLLKKINASNTKSQIVLQAYPDVNLQGQVTLPRYYQTMLAIARLPPAQSQCFGMPLRTRGLWYEFYSGGGGVSNNQTIAWSRGSVPINATFTTFADWTTPQYLRLKFETTEAVGLMIFRGTLNGQRIYCVINGVWAEGCPLGYSGSTTVTTTQLFDAPPYAVIKPTTIGRVSLYTVDPTSGAEVLVAIYDPTETIPAWKRYKVPVCSKWTSSSPGLYLAVVKNAYYALSSPNDPVFPSNIGALRWGLQALTEEDNQDERATSSWNKAVKILADEVEDDTGYGSEGVLQRTDDFAIGAMYGGI
jgi:hypothetical protein